jgi:hypothetical protein
MKLKSLAPNYHEWLSQRETDMNNDLVKSEYTTDLFKQYKKHLGQIRYFILIEGQKLIIPERVRKLLRFSQVSLLSFVLPFYKFSKRVGLDRFIKKLLLPKKYEREIYELDIE